MVLPTGGGKTTVFGSLVDYWFSKQKKCLIVVHRIELVEQVVDNLKNFGIYAGIIAGGYPRDYTKLVQVGMIQSLGETFPFQFDYIVIDECHHSASSSYKKLWNLFPEAKLLGVTATPVRTDGKGFEDLYTKMIDLYSLPWLIQNGFLVKPKHYFCSELQDVPIINGEYDFTAMSKEMRSNKHIADVIDSYQRYTPNKRAVVFAVDIEHSKELVTRFNQVGISAEHIDGEIPSVERKAIINRFKKGETKILCNFNIVSEGFDVPAIEAVILAKRSKSLSWYLQAIGRVLRLDKKNGKTHGYILDCASAYLDHGFAGIGYQWSLEAKKELIEESIVKTGLFKKKERGGLEPLLQPEEIRGVDMIALTEEYEVKCGNIQVFLNKALEENKPIEEGVLFYNDLLQVEGRNWSQIEINYCLQRTGLSEEKLVDLLAAC
jgi:superfamily II DNA or RNA helicase